MSNTTLLLIVIATMMLVAVPVVMMLKDFMPRVIQRSSGLEQLENRIYVLHSEIHVLQDRVAAVTQRRNQVASDKQRVDNDNRKLERAIAEIALQPPLFVHEVGEPQAGRKKFLVNLELEKASATTRAGGDAGQVNPIWRCSNVAEVWANSVDEANQLVEVAFPFKLGFTKSVKRTAAPRPSASRRKEAVS